MPPSAYGIGTRFGESPPEEPIQSKCEQNAA